MHNENEINEFINEYEAHRKQESKINSLGKTIITIVFMIAFTITVIAMSIKYPEIDPLRGMDRATETIKFSLTLSVVIAVGGFIILVGPLFALNRRFQKYLKQRQVLAAKIANILDENGKDINDVEVTVAWPKGQDEISIIVSIGEAYNKLPYEETTNVKSKIAELLNNNTHLFDLRYLNNNEKSI